MEINQPQRSIHLDYFLCLEDDLIDLSRYIEFCTENYSVHSIELARLLMTTCAEVDVVSQKLYSKLNAEKESTNIKKYQLSITKAFPMLHESRVEIPRFGLSFSPWKNWKFKDNPPEWWTSNNKVKHHRSENFHLANLGNVLTANAALLILILILQSHDNHFLSQTPRLYSPRTFASPDQGRLRLILPDGVILPKDWQEVW